MALLGDMEIKEQVDTLIDAPAAARPPGDLPGDVPTPTWYFKEGVPGHGDKPEYLLEKYKSVEDQARAYVEAQKALGAMSGAPDQYDFGDLVEHIDIENEHLKELQEWAKQNKISQEAMTKFSKKFMDYAVSSLPDEAAEIEKIDASKLSTLQNWVKQTLTKESIETLNKLPVSVEMFNALSELRHAALDKGSNAVTKHKLDSVQRFQSKQDIEDEMAMNYEKYRTDRVYQANIYKRLEEADAREMR